jgi:hypothetical protein
MTGAIRAEIRISWPFGVLVFSMLFGVAWSGDLIGHDTAQRDAEHAGRGYGKVVASSRGCSEFASEKAGGRVTVRTMRTRIRETCE